MTKEQVYEKVLIKWGEAFQMDRMVGKCAELIVALQKFNHRYGEYSSVIEELVDVEIMCEQMRIIFDSNKIDKIKKEKLKRLESWV